MFTFAFMLLKKNHTEGYYTFEYHEAEKFCLVAANGNITMVSTFQAMKTLARDPRFGMDFNIIVDLRLSTFHPSYYEMTAINTRMLLMKKYFRNKTAIVTTGFLWVLAELTSRITSAKGMNTKAFTDMDKAIKWVTGASEGTDAQK